MVQGESHSLKCTFLFLKGNLHVKIQDTNSGWNSVYRDPSLRTHSRSQGMYVSLGALDQCTVYLLIYLFIHSNIDSVLVFQDLSMCGRGVGQEGKRGTRVRAKTLLRIETVMSFINILSFET